jgi:TRAP-type C4-dicarboxylate transport system substrate-binding protein
MRTIRFKILLVLGLCGFLLSFSPAIAAEEMPNLRLVAAENPIIIKVTNFLPAEHLISVVMEVWARDLEKATKGRVKVRVYHSATIAAPIQQYDAVVRNIVEAGNHVLGYTVNRFPLSEVLDLPLGIPNGLVATKMMNEYVARLKPKEFDDVKVLWLHGPGPGHLCTRNKPIQKLEDLKGLRVRTYGGNARFMQALGAIPVGMPMTEVYEALAGGMVDGLLAPLESLESFKTGDHVRYITQNLWTSYTSCMLVSMNKKTWNSLSPDIQKAIDDLSKEQPERFGRAWDNAEQRARTFMDHRGVKYLSLSSGEEQRWFDKGTQPVFEDYTKRMRDKNLPGDQALKMVLDYLKPYKR